MTPPDVKNGVYQYIFNHMRYMDLQQYQFSFLTKGGAALRRVPEYEMYRFGIYDLEGTQREDEGKFRRNMWKILENGFDIIHLHTSSWRGFLIEEIAMELKIPRVIVHSHSTGIDEISPAERAERLHTHEAYKKQFSMEYATDVWACSWMAADWLYGDSIPRNQIQIMKNAIDVEKYRYHSPTREAKRAQLGLHGKFVVGQIGRYAYQKNHEFLIRAFADAAQKNDSLYLLCIGEGELLPQLQRLTGSLGIANRVRYLGWQEHVEEYLQAMDLFCLPSRFEGLAISAIEAQAAGLPCLISEAVTREAAVTERVSFLPLEQQMWTKAILDSVRNSRRTGCAQEVVRAGYDIRLAAKRLEDMYECAEA